MEINILNEEDFKPSTITIAGSFNISVDIKNIADWIPIKNIFDKDGKRQHLVSGSRESIKYFGPEGCIVSMCYKKTRRGMRTGAMNNMISADMQYNHKNIHLKISSTRITSVGTNSLEDGEKVFKLMTQHIVNLKNLLDEINLIDKEEKIKNIEWLTKNINNDNCQTLSQKIKNSTEDINSSFLNFCSLFIEDQDDMKLYLEKISQLLDPVVICNDELECNNFTIYNSVYHISPIEKRNFRMPLHRLAPFLANKGIAVEYHNWTSEGVNICFDIEERKSGLNHCNKEYKHRFSIHETTKIRQCSPTHKKEAYSNYLGVMMLLKEFFKHPEVDFNKYICENLEEKRIIKDYLLVKS